MKASKQVLLGPIFVAHHPYTYGDKKYEEPWKEAVAAECHKAWLGKPRLQEPVHVRLMFYLRRDYDLTGLLESTVNGIANAIFPPSKYGGHKTKWNYDDRWVYSIQALKQTPAGTCGVEILVEKSAGIKFNIEQ